MTTPVTEEQRNWFRHDPGCETPDLMTTTGKMYGDPALYCKVCRVFAVLPPRLRTTERVPAATQEPDVRADLWSEESQFIRSRYLLVCVRCETHIYLDNARPRVPLCQFCKEKR